MSIQDLINLLSKHQYIVFGVICAIPLISFFAVLMQGKKNCRESKIRYLYSVLIYLSCIPGMFAAVLTGYSLFFLRTNLLRLNLFVYILPIIAMTVTLLIIKRKNSFKDIPGFDRILGLMLMMAVSFLVAFAIYRTVILIGFFGSFANLFVIAVIIFILLKIAAAKLFKK
ncbi:hypothetical protein ACFLRB_02675 [Acidobacteriota bacterium]